MKCGELKENISGPIIVTDISNFTGNITDEVSVVSGPVCQPNAEKSGIGEEEKFQEP